MLLRSWHRFWADECGGFLNSAELIFLGALLVIGIIPGATALRDALVMEFVDMAAAVRGEEIPAEPDPDLGFNQITVCSDLYGN